MSYNQGLSTSGNAYESVLSLDPTSSYLGVNRTSPMAQLDVGGSIRADTFDGVEWGMVSNKPLFSNVAYTGSYADLTGRPMIPTVPTVPGALSGFSNDLILFANALTTGALTAASLSSSNLTITKTASATHPLLAMTSGASQGYFCSSSSFYGSDPGLNTLTVDSSDVNFLGAINATNSNLNHTIGNIASTSTGVSVYGSLAVSGTAGINTLMIQNRLYHSGQSSNLKTAVINDIVIDLIRVINADSNAILRLKELGVFDAYIAAASNT
ncbi:hypothetical protein TSOC_004213 [Tetrabaena socialis]|uniref:Uncharacterized protein n=1 Tax=Tetrabaena socialis TaxID=47790 RepID=A0A2J8A9G3_9CHLO|nr:hypothetical protein TSOC_004213 [Tetrabaena socialis]|eukprot:PNH09164.1 hypothetical protein TSOC_004213 [Tetrabaena socialis]